MITLVVGLMVVLHFDDNTALLGWEANGVFVWISLSHTLSPPSNDHMITQTSSLVQWETLLRFYTFSVSFNGSLIYFGNVYLFIFSSREKKFCKCPHEVSKNVH